MLKSLSLAALFSLQGLLPQNAAAQQSPAQDELIEPTAIETVYTPPPVITDPEDEEEKQESKASDFSLVLAFASYHLLGRTYDAQDGTKKPINEMNPGIGLEYRINDKFHIVAATYKNSIENQSFYFSAGYERGSNSSFGYGLELGLATGYTEFPAVPLLNPYMRIGERDSFNIKIGALPAPKNIVLTLQGRVNVGSLIPGF